MTTPASSLEKRENMKIASLLDKRNPKNANAHKKVQEERTNTYQKEQQEYILGQINKIKNLVEDIPSQRTWQKVNEVSKRKSNLNAKLKADKKNKYR